MAYQIDRYNNTLLTVVDDGTIDQTTDLKFIGKNYAGYGEIQNENFLYLLENFAGANRPARPLSGQIWFDSANSKLKFYDGSQFRTTGGSEISDDEPTGLSIGDFWWDATREQLFVFNGNNYTLIGPQRAGEGVTQMKSVEVTDTSGNPRGIITATVGDTVIVVISAEEFELSSSTPIEGFDKIKKGVTLKWTKLVDNGVTNSTDIDGRNFRFWGTASDSSKLGGELADNFVKKNDLSFNTRVEFGDAGIAIGESQDLHLKIENGNESVIQNVTGQNSLIKIKNTNASGTLTHVATFSTNGVLPGENNSTDIGSSDNIWKTVYANEFVGTSTKSETLRVENTYREASVNPRADTIAVRDSTGNVSANLFQGTATQARYADLAEKYVTDKEYSVGTLLSIGGKEEATVATASSIVIGVISEYPAYLMNADSPGEAVALTGRVPVRVVGPVVKGDVIYSFANGCASSTKSDNVVGIALETNSATSEKLVECILKV